MSIEPPSVPPLDAWPHIQELQAELLGHPGHLAWTRWQALSDVYRMMRLNENELVALLDQPNADPDLAIELIQNVRPRTVAERYELEAYRLIHNYMASAVTLIDHSRVVMDREDRAGFTVAYEERKGQIAAEPVAAFLKRLRHEILHHRLPMVASTVRWTMSEDGGHDYKLVLGRDDLLANSDWTGPARRYVQQQSEQFPIRQPISEYRAIIDGFYVWLFDEASHVHAEDFSARNELVRELRRLLGGDLEGGPDAV